MTSLECFGKGWLLVTLALSFLTRPCVLSAKSKMKDSLGMKGSACLGSGMVSGALVPKGYCAQIYAEQLSKPRGLFFLDKARILIVEAGKGQITLLEDRNGNGRIDPSEHRVIASAPGLNHGLFVRSGYVYASSSTAVYRWKFLPKGMKIKFLKKELVIRGIPGGGHWTRTLVFDKSDNLYVSIGSAGNVDPDSSRSRVVRFTKQQLKKLPQAWARGEVFADGLRNEVGLAFDSRGRLWGSKMVWTTSIVKIWVETFIMTTLERS